MTLVSLKAKVRKRFRELLDECKFQERGSYGFRDFPDQRQSLFLYHGRYNDWYSIAYAIRLFRTEAEKTSEFSFDEQDVFGDIRDICGGEQGTVWQFALNLEIERSWEERAKFMKMIFSCYLVPRLDHLADKDLILRLIKRDHMRAAYGVSISRQGYGLIGGYENVVHGVSIGDRSK